MPSVFYRIVLVSGLIFLGGWLGLKMAVPPGYASPIWPPAGIALAALLLSGKRLWPAIWIGAFANNISAGLDAVGELSATVVCSAALIGLASTIQALIAVRLGKKFVDCGVPRLDNPRQVLTFFLLTGPLACLIAPCIGVTGLYLLEVLPASELKVSWWNWWFGDSLGVLLVAPLAFCLFAEPRPLWQPRMLRVALPLLGALLALSTAFVFVFRAEQARIQMTFDSQAAAIESLMLEYVGNVLDSTLVLKDLLSASEIVDRREFSRFSQGLLKRHPEVQALEWLPRVTWEQLPSFEQAVRAEGFADFKVTERAADGSLIPVGRRDEYFPILFVEPMAGNEKAFGLDSSSNPVSLESKRIASRTGQPSVSRRLTLAQQDDTEIGVLVSIPVFDQPGAGAEHLAGFVSTVLLPARMAQIALQGINSDQFGISLRDTDAPPEQANLFLKAVANQVHRSYGLKYRQREFQFCDRGWLLSIVADKNFITEHGSILPWATLLGGLCFTSLLTVLLLVMTGRTAQAEALVNARTRELESANAELEAIASDLQASEAKLRTLVQSQPECVKLLARDGSLLDMNQAGLALIEADSLEQVKGQNVLPLVQPKYQQAFADSIQSVFAGEPATLEFEITGLKGTHRWMDTHAVPMRDNEGNIVALLGLTRDITARKAAEEELKLAARVFGEAHEGILITDANAIIIDVNPTFSEITGYSREEIIGKNPRILQSGKHNREFYQEMWNTLTSCRHWQGEVWNRKKNGELYAELLTMSALCNDQGEVINYLGLFSDITHFKNQQQMLELLAHYDPLTRLPNRTLFADRLLQAIARSKREKSLLAICFLDLDGFKPVNDQFGHETGDQVLIEVAERLKSCLREEDTVSRHGGDEFALLMGDLHTIEECTQTLGRIHQSIAEVYLINEHTINIGVSSGITIFPLDAADSDTLLRHADHAMYQAKLSGKNRYHLFDASHDQLMIDLHKQLHDIETAFADDQFCLYYQPKVNIKTGQVAGAEALIRWQHPLRGLLAPQAFLPVIASSELEIRVGNWVIEQAWQQLCAWQQLGFMLEVSVNISAYHLLWPKFVEHLETTLASHPGIASRYLQLEILESTALDDLSAVNRVIKVCRDALGVTTALDDFGTGYSSLAHLRHLPVNAVKIDKGFVRDMLDDPDDYAIVESVISLSQAFRHEVIAEGVETQEQGLMLLLMDCHLAQGYAIAKPMPAEEMLDWISHYRPYPQWRDYAGKELTALQIQVAIRRIDLEQWLQRINQCLNGGIAGINHWPIMLPGKSHFGRWLKQAQYQDQYNKQWLAQLAALHAELLHKGDVLMHQFWEGETEAARAGFAELTQTQRRLDDCLTKYA